MGSKGTFKQRHKHHTGKRFLTGFEAFNIVNISHLVKSSIKVYLEVMQYLMEVIRNKKLNVGKQSMGAASQQDPM